MKKIFVLAVFGTMTLMPLCYAMGQRTGNTDSNAATATNANAQVNADINASTNASTNAGVTTSMNGNTSTSAGVPISSTAASAESRNTSGSAN